MKEEDRFPDKIFVRGHLTLAENLMFANAEISALKKEIGQLKSEIDFLENQIKIVPITRAENIEIRKGKMLVDIKARNKKLQNDNKKLMKSNGELIAKLYTNK